MKAIVEVKRAHESRTTQTLIIRCPIDLGIEANIRAGYGQTSLAEVEEMRDPLAKGRIKYREIEGE